MADDPSEHHLYPSNWDTLGVFLGSQERRHQRCIPVGGTGWRVSELGGHQTQSKKTQILIFKFMMMAIV